MPVLTIKTTFTGSGVPTAAQLNENFEEDETNSFAILRGHLDADNYSGDIETVQIKRRAFANGGMVARTVNHDFFAQLFTGAAPSGGTDPDDAYHSIVGASAVIYIPKPISCLYLGWSISLGHDSLLSGDGPHLHFRFNGTRAEGSGRRCPPAIVNVSGTNYRLGRHRDRVYSGHHLETDLAAGEYEAGLWVSARCTQTRLRCASLKWFWLA